ncbi:hypothetical protein BS50DRAFT_74529 [Corynespora cassiicola Philippines]|uniref:Uncharacterized protein n=1 Tax=Corynespora cassiicola Philippines TaxID=1448308 RepID=A0A2T2NGF1_CORCC|nr:hypothetical protein BS50DRAFT_74529 [Corynespora cassiicola Philippines]
MARRLTTMHQPSDIKRFQVRSLAWSFIFCSFFFTLVLFGPLWIFGPVLVFVVDHRVGTHGPTLRSTSRPSVLDSDVAFGLW